MFAVATGSSIANAMFWWGGDRMAVWLQESVAQLVFDKALALAPAAKQRTGVGAIVSHMQIDAKKIATAAPLLHFLWSAPLQIGVAAALLHAQLGASAFVALGTCLALLPLETLLARRQAAFTKALMAARDARVKAMFEMLQATCPYPTPYPYPYPYPYP